MVFLVMISYSLERVVKEAIHELGHTYGLGHCRDARCIMYFSNSLLDTDRKGAAFCVNCRRMVEEARRVEEEDPEGMILAIDMDNGVPRWGGGFMRWR